MMLVNKRFSQTEEGFSRGKIYAVDAVRDNGFGFSETIPYVCFMKLEDGYVMSATRRELPVGLIASRPNVLDEECNLS